MIVPYGVSTSVPYYAIIPYYYTVADSAIIAVSGKWLNLSMFISSYK